MFYNFNARKLFVFISDSLAAGYQKKTIQKPKSYVKPYIKPGNIIRPQNSYLKQRIYQKARQSYKPRTYVKKPSYSKKSVYIKKAPLLNKQPPTYYGKKPTFKIYYRKPYTKNGRCTPDLRR